jgi:hypothetical protein
MARRHLALSETSFLAVAGVGFEPIRGVPWLGAIPPKPRMTR